MEGTSTLADALLDDLDDLSDVEEETYEEEDVSMQQEMVPESLSSQYDWWPRHQKRLLDDPELQKHVLVIRNIMDAKSKRANTTTDQQQQQQQQREEDHKLLVKSNEYLLAAANDLNTEHTSLCAAYEPKFPELEELVPDATQYVNAVRCIGNESDLTSKAVNDSLNGFLSNHQIITLSVAGSTSAGRPLTELELQRVDQIATYMEEIMAIRELLTQHIEQQMESTCPNMTALIGPSTSAKLLSLTGGLPALAKIPACNLQVLGQVKQSRNGMVSSSSSMATPHQGVLVQADLVQCCPRHLQPKVLKMVAAKLALAIRCDFVNADAGRTCTAASGRLFREQIEKKFVQLQEPDKAPVLKALPKPDLTVKKRRGGARMRRLKGRYETTALMKQANTRAFSAQAGEYGDDAMGKTLGLLDASVEAGGALRKNNAEKRKMKYANTRASRKKAAQMNAKSSSANTCGLASSMVFTPVQGMELVNPDAIRDRIKEANRKWFSNNAGFQSALPKK